MPLLQTLAAASAYPYGGFSAASAATPDVSGVFSSYLYTGTGVAQTINNGVDLTGDGGLVWIKGINGTSLGNADHALHDSVLPAEQQSNCWETERQRS